MIMKSKTFKALDNPSINLIVIAHDSKLKIEMSDFDHHSQYFYNLEISSCYDMIPF